MVYVQPTKKPEWNTGGSNRTEPSAGEKIAGWVVDDEPPSSYFNWLQYYTGAWLFWLNERLYKGAAEYDVTLTALQPDTTGRGGDLVLESGNANTTGQGGDVDVNCGDAVGAGNGGNFDVACGDGVGSIGGSLRLDAGDCASGTGAGGLARIRAGDSLATGDGGDASLAGGHATDGDGGALDLTGGNAGGTNKNAGAVSLSTGNATGSGYGVMLLKVAEAGAGGTSVRTPQEYFQLYGTSKYMRFNRHVRMYDAVDTTRGVVQLGPKAQPSGPLNGDIYPDSTTNQLGFYNGTRYHNLNPLVYNISDDGIVGDNPSSPASTTVVLNETPYGGAVGTTPLRYIIPANTLRVGSVVRVRAMFVLLDDGGGASYPSPKLYIGSIGVGPSPYTAPTGVKIFDPNRAAKIWDNCSVEADLCVRGIGAAGAVDLHWRSWFDEGGAAVSPVDNGLVVNTYTLATNAALDVFAAVLFGTSTGWDVTLYQFIVDVI